MDRPPRRSDSQRSTNGCSAATFPGDLVPRPKSQLAIILGATHVTMMLETPLVTGMIVTFLDEK